MPMENIPNQDVVLKKEKLKKIVTIEQWKRVDTVLWCLVFVVCFSILFDLVIFDQRLWIPIITLKLAFIVFFLAVYNYLKNKIFSPIYLLHFIIASFNSLCILLIIQDNLIIKLIYSNLMVIVFCVFNMFILWRTRNSLFQLFFITLLVIVLYQKNIIVDLNYYLDHGAIALFMISLTSCIFTNIRRTTFEDKVLEKINKNKDLVLVNNELTLAKSKLKLVNQRMASVFEKYYTFNEENNNKILEIKNKASYLLENESVIEKKQELIQVRALSKEITKRNSLLLQELNLQTKQTNPDYNYKTIYVYDFYKKISNYFTDIATKKQISLTDSNIIEVDVYKTDILALEIALRNIYEFMIELSPENSELKTTIVSTEKVLGFEFNHNYIKISPKELENRINPSSIGENSISDNKLNTSRQIIEFLGGYLTYAASDRLGVKILFQFNK